MTPEQRTRPSLYERYRALTTGPLQFPLVGEENRPIRDAKGRLVSVTEHAPLFVAAANLCAEVAALGPVSDLQQMALLFHNIDERARKIVEQK